MAFMQKDGEKVVEYASSSIIPVFIAPQDKSWGCLFLGV